VARVGVIPKGGQRRKVRAVKTLFGGSTGLIITVSKSERGVRKKISWEKVWDWTGVHLLIGNTWEGGQRLVL